MVWKWISGILAFIMMFTISREVNAQSTETRKIFVNDNDINLALHSGIHCISNILNPEDNNRPYFECYVFDHPRMKFTKNLSVGNVTGRCLYALLSSSQALGEEADVEIVSKYRQVLLDSYEKVRGIPADPRKQGGPLEECWIFNSGQGLRGLVGLTVFTHDGKARQYLDESISNLRKYFADEGFSWRAFSRHFGLIGGGTGGPIDWPDPDPFSPSKNPFLTWPVARYARLSKTGEAFELARILGNSRFDYRFPPDGIIRLYGKDHGFGIAAETNALAEVGMMLSDERIMQRVKSRIDNGLSKIMTESGWFPERLEVDSDVGEINNTAEIIEACLLLGEWGWPEYYGIAERYTRGHLLPSQLLDMSIIPASSTNPPNDGEARVRERVKGAFGFPAPYGHLATMNPYMNGAFFFDIVAGGVATLAEVRRHCYNKRGNDHYVNLLFDFENDKISIKSPYPNSDTIKIILKDQGNLYLRLSNWVDRGVIKGSVEGQNLTTEIQEPYFIITNPPLNKTISIRYPLTLSETAEELNGRTLRILWRGDSIIGMSSMGTSLPFYPEIDAAQRQIKIERLGPDCVLVDSGSDEKNDEIASHILEKVQVELTPSGVMKFNGVESRLRYGVPLFPDNNYTFEAWIQPATETSGVDIPQRLFSGWHGYYEDPLRLSIRSGKIFAGLETNGKSYETSRIQFPAPGWFHVAVVKKGEVLKIHVNGKEEAQVSVPVFIKNDARNIGIGFNPLYVDGEFYHGAIGPFTFRACALDDHQIKDVMGPMPEGR